MKLNWTKVHRIHPMKGVRGGGRGEPSLVVCGSVFAGIDMAFIGILPRQFFTAILAVHLNSRKMGLGVDNMPDKVSP